MSTSSCFSLGHGHESFLIIIKLLKFLNRAFCAFKVHLENFRCKERYTLLKPQRSVVVVALAEVGVLLKLLWGEQLVDLLEDELRDGWGIRREHLVPELLDFLKGITLLASLLSFLLDSRRRFSRFLAGKLLVLRGSKLERWLSRRNGALVEELPFLD